MQVLECLRESPGPFQFHFLGECGSVISLPAQTRAKEKPPHFYPGGTKCLTYHLFHNVLDCETTVLENPWNTMHDLSMQLGLPGNKDAI